MQEKSDSRPADKEASKEESTGPAQTDQEKARAQRLATYAKPQLKNRAQPKTKTPKATEVSVEPLMSKAQKRNTRRSRIRKESLA